jgi:hypothetical protein
MNLLKILIFFLLPYTILWGQKNMIEEIFSQDVFREDFKESSEKFPTEQIGDKFAILLEAEDQYFIGTEKSNYTVMVNWENDLTEFELRTVLKMAPEEKLSILPGQTPQIAGIIMQYNPDTQEGLIFEINSFKKYRLVYMKNDSKNRNLTYSKDNDWVKSENLKKNKRNEIRIKSKENKFEFYINGEFEFKIDLNKKRIDSLSAGRFGFHLGPQTKIKIDYLYISASQNYTGMNQLLKLTEEEIKAIISENIKLKEKKESDEIKEIEDLKQVIRLVETQLKELYQINDSLIKKNLELEPFRELMGDNKDFIYTLSKDLENEIKSTTTLKEQNRTLMDSIEILHTNQKLFKLEYLKAIESIRGENKKDTIE